jgi:predicted glutamine amidotransferase
MCQLFALESNAPTAATFSLSGFAARGGQTAEHVDGFGVAFHEASGCRVFVDAGRASDSPLAEFLCRHPIRAQRIVAHIRKATQGPVGLVNCHPFRRDWWGRSWTFCHNGDLKGFRPRLDGPFVPVGQTDSERAFCWLLQQLRASLGDAAAPHWSKAAPVLAELSADIARHGAFNFLLCDGEALYAHATHRLHWLERSHPFGRVRLVDRDLEIDLSQANGPEDRMVLVATEPLTHGEPWSAFEPGELQVFADGRRRWRSVSQGAEALA